MPTTVSCSSGFPHHELRRERDDSDPSQWTDLHYLGYGTTGSVMLRLRVDGTKAAVEKVWESRELDNQHGGVLLWNDHLYGAAHNFNGASGFA